jgi:phosphoglycolate phosphatase-like HAD superfamily hydrolase
LTVANLPCPWNGFDAYLFDIDGTLLTCADAVHYFAFCQALECIAGRPLTLEGVTAHGNTDVGILRDAFALAGVSEDKWRPLLRNLLDGMGQFVHAREQELCVTVLPHAHHVLEHLRNKGAILGVATGNLRAIGQLKLQRAGLFSYFQFAAWSDAYEYRADVFRYAIAQARSIAGQNASICVIGDTPGDIAAARQNGLPVISVATGVHSFDLLKAASPDLCICSLEDLFAPAQVLPA